MDAAQRNNLFTLGIIVAAVIATVGGLGYDLFVKTPQQKAERAEETARFNLLMDEVAALTATCRDAPPECPRPEVTVRVLPAEPRAAQ